MKFIKPLFCLEEGCVPFTAVTLSIFPSGILPFSSLLSSNVLYESASQASVFCMSSGWRVVQYPEFFIAWFIFDLYILVLCSIYLMRVAWLLLHSFWNGNYKLLCFSSAFLQRSDLDSRSLDCIKIQIIIKIWGKYVWSSESEFCISQCFPSDVLFFLPFCSLWTPMNALL